MIIQSIPFFIPVQNMNEEKFYRLRRSFEVFVTGFNKSFKVDEVRLIYFSTSTFGKSNLPGVSKQTQTTVGKWDPLTPAIFFLDVEDIDKCAVYLDNQKGVQDYEIVFVVDEKTAEVNLRACFLGIMTRLFRSPKLKLVA